MAKETKVQHIDVEEEMRTSYMDYAMSVIVSRALPDVRDGLKPVHRRILYAMRDLNLTPTRPFRKCAKITGDVSGNYHPHGADIVYPSLVRMAQDFSMRYPLIDGQGNFGSMDGDPPAAMRYTEARMTSLALAVLEDIDKDTVDYRPNYDSTREEPTVLPSSIPNLLLNGSAGIAVGMATSIPPHNLSELVDGFTALLEKPDLSIEELMDYIPGPDFPTGGIIQGREGIKQAYGHGRGLMKVRAKTFVEGEEGQKQKIIISEMPYQVNKARLLETIAELVKDKKIEGISDLNDESDKDGLRVVIELKRDKDPQIVLNKLFRHTEMQTTFGIILLSLIDGQPRICNLKRMMEEFLKHRQEVIKRRTIFELNKAKEKAHILEGLKVALDNLDKIIKTIRSSSTAEDAKTKLIKSFSLSEKQAQAILEMRLQRLTGLERKKVQEDYLATIKEITRLDSILKSSLQIRNIIQGNLREIKEKFGDERRTQIGESVGDLDIEDLIAEEDMVITVSQQGYVKRLPLSTYRKQHRGGKGIIGAGTKEEDLIETMFIASTHDYILCFTTDGKVHWIKVYEIPQAGRLSKGKAVVNFLNLNPEQSVSAFLPVRDFTTGGYVFMTTKKGKVKKVPLDKFSHPRRTGITAISLLPEDRLIRVNFLQGEEEVLLATRVGKAIHFSSKQVRPMGRTAQGIRGITLNEGDEVVGMEIAEEDKSLLVITEKGFGKRSDYDRYPLRGRGGKGVINIRSSKRNGEVVGVRTVTDKDELLIATTQGKVIRIPLSKVKKISRNTLGVKLMSLDPENKVSSVAAITEEMREEDEEPVGKTPKTDIKRDTRDKGRRTKGRQQKTGNRGQKTENRKRKTGEPRTKNKEQKS